MTSHAQMKASTGHIQVCRRAWHEHELKCSQCWFLTGLKCELGETLYGEYQASITANRDCEHITMEGDTCTILTK